MNSLGLNAILTTPRSSADSKSTSSRDPEKIADAAKQFEALMIEEMLKSARASGTGDWSGTGEDQTGSTMSEMAEQQFAQLLAAKGGFGIAKLVVAGFDKK